MLVGISMSDEHDTHRLGIADQNRALVCAALTGALSLLVGIGIGSSIRRK